MFDDVQQELAVSSVVLAPAAVGTRVGLHVDPDHPVLLRRD